MDDSSRLILSLRNYFNRSDTYMNMIHRNFKILALINNAYPEIQTSSFSDTYVVGQYWLYSFMFVAVLHCKVTSFNKACLEAHAGFFRLVMKGVFDNYVL